jgi:RND family efflux transporter MFP subunit
MTTMNFETTGWRRESLEGEVVVEPLDETRRRRTRRALIIGAVLAVVALVAAYLLYGQNSEPAAGSPGAAGVSAGGAGGAGRAAPRVTVVVPGRQQVARTVSATGTLAARVDMPVGVAGEGGMVTRVLVQPGQWVRAGQTLATIDRGVQNQQAEQMAAQIQVTRADAQLAEQELARAQSLVSRGFVSKADVDRRVATRDAANARIRVGQAQLNEMRARIGRLDIRSPASGLVLQRNVEPGQVVGGGTGALFRVAAGGDMELRAQLSEADLAATRVGTPATVTPVGSATSYQGRVWQVAPVIDPASRQGTARIAVPYREGIRPGGFASATLAIGQVDAPMLPQSAVLSDERGNFVYLVNGRNEIERRDVKVGTTTSAGVVIQSGISGQERIVQSAGAFLNPGQKVTPTRAAAR